jgi:hypothetical protein
MLELVLMSAGMRIGWSSTWSCCGEELVRLESAMIGGRVVAFLTELYFSRQKSEE